MLGKIIERLPEDTLELAAELFDRIELCERIQSWAQIHEKRMATGTTSITMSDIGDATLPQFSHGLEIAPPPDLVVFLGTLSYLSSNTIPVSMLQRCSTTRCHWGEDGEEQNLTALSSYDALTVLHTQDALESAIMFWERLGAIERADGALLLRCRQRVILDRDEGEFRALSLLCDSFPCERWLDK